MNAFALRKLPLLRPALLLTLALMAGCGAAQAETTSFSFGVIAHVFRSGADETPLHDAISETDADNLAFVVANGIKAGSEPCTDKLYGRRKALLNSAKNGLIVSLSASDWVACKTSADRSAAIERLSRIRDLFFSDEFSFGDSKIPLIRQSTSPKFRSYVENARWEIGNVVFATINLPATNNHYLPEGGRNSEFEDRQIANREWLQRIFLNASQKKSDAVVLFCDGDPLAIQRHRVFDFNVKRDGFAEIRQKISSHAAHFEGKVLVIHGPHGSSTPHPASIEWQRNLGDLEIPGGWLKITVNPANPKLFEIGKPADSQTLSRR
ncbi:hypothetical protein SAMN04515618_10692 [Collimonas sp. OK307]|uniref:hypothetical protein n=1 Tax=Collimonas sp. OK307 TaxID=1801620 RepID=UPI0008E8171E|nr:hypothetical protein [Collimonas sp. OK307]SFH94379.1 hypothetical protein SAMN04515618_10692 [Collimonas sp. OK307]